MADLNVFNGTAKIDIPFERIVENGTEYAKGRLMIHNFKDFYATPWIVVEGRKIEDVMGLKEGQSVKIRNAALRSVNKTLEVTIPQRVLSVTGQLSTVERTFEKGYTEVHLFIDDRDGSDIIGSDVDFGEQDINSVAFTGRICTEPQAKIVGRNKNSLSFVSASNFAKKDYEPAYLYVVIEGKEAVRLDGRLAINSKFSGNAMLRTKIKPYLFEYEDTVIDEEASLDGMVRYKQVTRQVEKEVEQLEVLFLDYVSQLNFIDNIKNPDLAEQFGEI